jgi:hypothetical protein
VLTETCSTRTSALSFSAFSSNSMFKERTLGFLNVLGCCSNPAYEKLFLKATPLTNIESYTLASPRNEDTCIAPPGIFLIPISFSSRSSWSKVRTESTTILTKKVSCERISFEDMAVAAHFSNSSRNLLPLALSKRRYTFHRFFRFLQQSP